MLQVSIITGRLSTSGSSELLCPARKKKTRSSGFSLVEMLVVMTIIAILLGITMPLQRSLRHRAYSSKSRDQAQQVAQAWLYYFQEHRSFPKEELTKLPGARQADGDIEFPMSPEAVKLLSDFFEFSDIQMKVGVLSAWGDRDASIAARSAGGSDKLNPEKFADARVFVKLDTNYDGEVQWGTMKLKKSAIAWSPNETPDRPDIVAW